MGNETEINTRAKSGTKSNPQSDGSLSKEVLRVMEDIVKKHTQKLLTEISSLKTQVQKLTESNEDLKMLLNERKEPPCAPENDVGNSSQARNFHKSTISDDSAANKKQEQKGEPKSRKTADGMVIKSKQSEFVSAKIVRGTALDEGGSHEFSAAVRKTWLYVGRCRPETTEEHITSWLTDKFPGRSFTASPLQSKGYPSFRVGADAAIEDVLYEASTWPKDVLVKRFKFFRSDRQQSDVGDFQSRRVQNGSGQ